MAEQVSVTRGISAPANQVWEMVADVTQMGRWSPEHEEAIWLWGATSPVPGAAFRGMNRNGKKKWKTVGKIVDAEPSRLLRFNITAIGLKVSEWTYEFESTADGCQITETWVDRRGVIAKALGKPVTGVEDRVAHNRSGMEQTLDRLKSAAESTPA